MLAILAAVSHQAGIAFVSDLVVRIAVYLAAGLTAGSGVHYLLVVTEKYARKAED
jgi:hypothetical protein